MPPNYCEAGVAVFFKFLKTLFRWGFYLACAFVVLSASTVLILRWAPIPTSGIQVQRSLEARLENRSHSPAPAQWVALPDMSPHLARAVIAAEDQRFFEHFGFDFKQLSKAIAEHREGERLRGASTISQQTAKNLFLWGGRSFVRKGFEAWFTLLIEVFWPKERILEVYLNIVEFGPQVYGVSAASESFFRTHPRNITRYQAALLASVLPNPHRMQVRNPTAYMRERQDWILQQMRYLVVPID